MSEILKPVRRWPAWAQRLAFAVCLLPPAMLAWLLWHNAVNVPYWDEWDDDIAGLFAKWHTGHLTLGDFWGQHNESRFVLPRVIFLLLGMADWNLNYEVGCTFFLASLVAVAVFWLGQKTLADRPLAAWLAYFIASLLIFSPAQHEAWLWGMELILYLPLVCILAGLLVLRTELEWRLKLLLCIVFAMASTYSFSNGLLTWVVLFPALFFSEGRSGLKKRSRSTLLWVLAFTANASVYFQDYKFPESPGFWPVLCADPLRVIEYVCAFVGGPLANQNSSHQAIIATIVGGVELALFAAVCVVVFRWRKDSALMNRVWPWLTLGGYGVLSALLAMTGRVAFGVAQALSARYGIFGICLTVALAFLVPTVLFQRTAPEDASRVKRFKSCAPFALFSAAVIGLQALALPAAIWNLKVFSLDLRHAKTCLKFLDVLPPQSATTAYLYPNYPKLKPMADALDHAKALNYSLHQTRRLADFKQVQPTTDNSGGIEISRVIGTNLFLSGWALAPARHAAADCVVFTCEAAEVEPRIFALMDSRWSRRDLVEKFHDRTFLPAGWKKTCPLAALPKSEFIIKAWSYDVETDQLMLLGAGLAVDNR